MSVRSPRWRAAGRPFADREADPTALGSQATVALVRARAITCAYDRGPNVLEDVSVEITTGDFVGIVGPSGSGKSTLLRALLGSVTPRSGHVERHPGLRIGYVPQVETVDWQFPVTVGECVLMARRKGRVRPWRSRAEAAEVHTVLDRLGIADLEDRHIRALSGGQQQRVFIARALLSRPQALILDEPTSGVDVTTRHDVLHLLRELHEDGLAIALTTHDLNGIASHLPRILCLNRVVVDQGPPGEVLTPEVLEATYGARMDVLMHAGLPVIVDGGGHRHDRPIPDQASDTREPDEGSGGASRRGSDVTA